MPGSRGGAVFPRLVACVGLVLAGCAFGGRHVNLDYGPALAVPASRPTRGRVAVARFADGRIPDEGVGAVVGKVRNGYGIPTAEVTAYQDPVLWVNDAVARMLANQGFEVMKVNGPDEAGSIPCVTGTVTRASADMYMSIRATVSADLAAERAGVSLGVRRCAGNASRVAWTASADEYRTVLEAALDDFASACGPSLVQLVTGDPAPR